MAIASVDSRVQKYKNLYADSMNKDLEAINKTAESQKQVVNDTYGKQIDDTKSSYAEQQKLNEIQKYINERTISENMANSGLSDSGLNATQQTAVQLSYANNKSKIENAMNSAVENFRLEMNSKLTDIENTRLSDESSIRQSYDNAALSAAQKEYNTEYDAETERYKAALSAASKSSSSSSSSKSSSGSTNLYTYLGTTYSKDVGTKIQFQNSSGKVVTVNEGVNPYTGDNNLKRADVKKFGTFSNGYQPKGVITSDYSSKLVDSGEPQQDVWGTGKKQTIWKDDHGKYWVWNGAENTYVNVSK